MTQTRKEFLKSLGILTVGACCGGSLLSLTGCASVPTVTASRNNNRISVAKSSLGDKTSVVVHHDTLKAPVFLHKLNDNEYTAVLMLCTHKDCELNPAGSVLQCPCHGSEFSQDGKLLEGPAETDLQKFPVAVEGESIVITL